MLYQPATERPYAHRMGNGLARMVTLDTDVRIAAQEIIKIREKINKLIALETGQPVEKVAKDSDRNFWMDANEALNYGLITKIITSPDEAV